MVMIHLFLFDNASLLGVLFFFFLWAGACMIEDGWRRNKGFIYVLLLERLIRVHGATSDVQFTKLSKRSKFVM